MTNVINSCILGAVAIENNFYIFQLLVHFQSFIFSLAATREGLSFIKSIRRELVNYLLALTLLKCLESEKYSISAYRVIFIR